MAKSIFTFMLLCAALVTPGTSGALVITDVNDAPDVSSTQPNPVIEWNRTLLQIVRTPRAQPATIHSTRNFAMLHIAIFEAVNSIDRSFEPYSDRMLRFSRRASAQAAADQSAHDVLIALYPSFSSTLDSELQQDLSQIPYGEDKDEGVKAGQAAAAEILALRSNDGSGATPPPFVPSESLPGVARHFNNFVDAAEEAGLSRIYAGQHFRFDHVAGQQLGRRVAVFVVFTSLHQG